MPEQLHQARQGHTGKSHLGGIGVSKLVGHDACTNTDGRGYLAQESTQFAKNNILVQSGTAMLAQANQTPQSVLKLLQG